MEFMKVIKRNGEEVNFDEDKIFIAISKANNELDDEHKLLPATIAGVAYHVTCECERLNRAVGVEEIQEMVENALIHHGWTELAKRYIRYRYMHNVARDKYDDLMSAIKNKIEARNVANQNANVDEKSFGGRVGEASNLMMRQYALDYCMSEMARSNHLNNEIYIHDLDHYAIGDHNCLTVPFDKLLANGFNTRQTDVRPANSLNTAMQLVAVIFQLQSLQQFGGVSASHIDWTMVPYVRKSFVKHYKDGLKYIEHREVVHLDNTENLSIEDDFYKAFPAAYQYAMDMTEKECHQSVEALYHNLNTLQSRSGKMVAA